MRISFTKIPTGWGIYRETFGRRTDITIELGWHELVVSWGQ